MPDSYQPRGFYVHASNIHTSESKRYGPFAGPPQLTYELLRANEDAGPPWGIFMWVDPQDTEPGNPHDYETWTDQEGGIRYDGWRFLERRPGSQKQMSYTVPVGPFWTDLVIEPVDE